MRLCLWVSMNRSFILHNYERYHGPIQARMLNSGIRANTVKSEEVLLSAEYEVLYCYSRLGLLSFSARPNTELKSTYILS